MDFWRSQDALVVSQWMARALVTFAWLFVVAKVMGQREVGRMTLFDFVVAIAIGSVAAGPLSSSRSSLIGSLIAIGILGGMQVMLAWLSLKSQRFRRVVQDEPIVLIQDGQILDNTMKKTRVNLGNLMSSLRQKGYPNLSDVEYAILEPDGKMSVIPKSQARPVTPQDLRVSTNYEGMPTVLIEDGRILEDNLRENGLTTDWLMSELKLQGIDDVGNVLAAVIDTRGRLFVSKKQ